MERKEKDLVRRAAQGDRSAMADLYNRNIRYLTAVCSRYIQNDDDRNDILQTSFVKIFSSLGLTLTAGVNLYLSQVVMQQRIPFSLTLSDDVKAELAAEKEAEYKS